jgi:hypothetical protein
MSHSTVYDLVGTEAWPSDVSAAHDSAKWVWMTPTAAQTGVVGSFVMRLCIVNPTTTGISNIKVKCQRTHSAYTTASLSVNGLVKSLGTPTTEAVYNTALNTSIAFALNPGLNIIELTLASTNASFPSGVVFAVFDSVNGTTYYASNEGALNNVWDASVTYSYGTMVAYNGTKYVLNKASSTAEAPIEPITAARSMMGWLPLFQAGKAYDAGSTVLQFGVPYKAVRYTNSGTPTTTATSATNGWLPTWRGAGAQYGAGGKNMCVWQDIIYYCAAPYYTYETPGTATGKFLQVSGVWDAGQAYARGAMVLYSDKPYFLNKASSTGETPLAQTSTLESWIPVHVTNAAYLTGNYVYATGILKAFMDVNGAASSIGVPAMYNIIAWTPLPWQPGMGGLTGYMFVRHNGATYYGYSAATTPEPQPQNTVGTGFFPVYSPAASYPDGDYVYNLQYAAVIRMRANGPMLIDVGAYLNMPWSSAVTFTLGSTAVNSSVTYFLHKPSSFNESPPVLNASSPNGWVPVWQPGSVFAPGNYALGGTTSPHVVYSAVGDVDGSLGPSLHTKSTTGWVPTWHPQLPVLHGDITLLDSAPFYYFDPSAALPQLTAMPSPGGNTTGSGWLPLYNSTTASYAAGSYVYDMASAKVYRASAAVPAATDPATSAAYWTTVYPAPSDGGSSSSGSGSGSGSSQGSNIINPQPYLAFYNDGNYIRVEDAKTAVACYFRKDKVIFHGDANTTLHMQTSALKKRYLFADVARPTAGSLKDLLAIFQRWVEQGNVAAGSVVVETPYLLSGKSAVNTLEVQTHFDKDPLKVAELLTSGASTAHDSGKNMVRMELSSRDAATGAEKAVRQTKSYASLVTNANMLAVLSATLLVDLNSTGVYSRAGCFDEGNGIFFELLQGDATVGATSELALVLRSTLQNGGDVRVPQAEWNVDTLDGNGASGVTLEPHGNEHTFVFEWSALRGNKIRAGIMHQGAVIFCHAFGTGDVRMGCASLPLRWELGSAGSAASSTAATMLQGPGSVMVHGSDADCTLVYRSKSNDAFRSVTRENSPQPLFSVRLRPDTNRAAKIVPRRLRLVNIEAGLAKWSLVLNPGQLTGASFADVGAGSYGQFSDAETAVSDVGAGPGTAGTVILASGYISQARGPVTIDVNADGLPLCSDVEGRSDVLTLVVTYMRGVVSVLSAIEWMEM